MFPILPRYFSSVYVRGEQPVYIADPNTVAMLERVSSRIIGLIRRGVKFTPTQPNALHIEKLMLAEYQSEKTGFEEDEGKKTLEQSTQKMSIKERIATSQAEAERRNSARAADHPQSSKHELER